MNVFNILETAAEKWPDKNAIIHDAHSITYKELLKKSLKLKQQLIENGVKKGSAISIIFPNSIDFIIALMGAVGTGAIVMPIYHQQKENEIKEAIENGQIHYFLTNDNSLSKHASSSKSIAEIGYTLHQTTREKKDKTAEFIGNPAFMRFTSGTTGKAKGVIISHKSVLERVDSANEVLNLTHEDNILWVLPMAFHFVVSIIMYLKYGTTIIINNSFLAEDMIANINKHKVTFFYGAPMHIRLLGSYSTNTKLPTLQKVISTTTAISSTICDAFNNKYNIAVSQAYGIIEIGLPIINTEKSATNSEAVGFCLPAYTVGILDEKYNELPNNTIGLLGIKGPGMFDGYLTPEITRNDILENDWFLTGDFAIRDNEGLITVKGREKNVINVSGNKVFPYEIEDVVNAYPNISKSKAYSQNHLLLGEVVALEVILEPNTTINKEELINYTRKLLSDYKIPQIITFVNEIEMTASGKIKRG